MSVLTCATGSAVRTSALRILLVEDDVQVGGMMQRVLEKAGHSVVRLEGGLLAHKVASEFQPDVILLDVDLPDISGLEVCRRLREDPIMSSVPVLMVSGHLELETKLRGFSLGADDYIPKPFRVPELLARIETVHRRARRNLDANPLTHLPGNAAIEREIARRLSKREKFAVLYCDIDHFKSYNDAYGFLQGDSVIRNTSLMILSCVETKSDFVGHIGGDDFVIVTSAEGAKNIAAAVAEKFDKEASQYYSLEDQAKGYLVVRNRRGWMEKTPVMSLSIAIVGNHVRTLDHPAQFSQIAAEIKRYLKGLPNRCGSRFLVDRRHDDAPIHKDAASVA